MTDKEEGKGTTPRGAEWEVVALTASTYAAAPGPTEVELKDTDRYRASREDEAETSRALFMSDHFVFPPSQHENLPLEPEYSENKDEEVGKDVTSEIRTEESQMWKLKDFNASGTEFDESTTLAELNLSDKKQSICSTAAFSSFHSETGFHGASTCGVNLDAPEVDEPSKCGLDAPPMGISLSPRHPKDGKYDGSVLPCEAWWKRGAVSWYNQAKEANAVCSIFIAAAVMGLVLLGQRWQQERWHLLQFKWQKNGSILGPRTRLKNVIVGGGHRRGSLIRGTFSGDN